LSTKDSSRVIIAGALAGALVGSFAALLYYRQRLAGRGGAGAQMGVQKQISWQKLGSLGLTTVGIIRQIIALAQPAAEE